MAQGFWNGPIEKPRSSAKQAIQPRSVPAATSTPRQIAPAASPTSSQRQPVTTATSSSSPQTMTSTLRLRITGLERNRKDMLIRFDASTNLPNFRASQYRNMQRSYIEFQMFAEQLAVGNPHAIVPALPPPQTSAVTDEEDDRLVRISLQRWLTRIAEDPVLQRDEELRSFIESDFGYSPVPRPGHHHAPQRSAATSAVVSGVTSRFSAMPGIGTIGRVFALGKGGQPPDEDEDLAIAKGELEKLEEKWANVARAVQGTGKARRALAQAQADSGAKLLGCAATEIHTDLAFAYKRIGKGWENMAGLLQAQAASDNIVLSDSFNYQSANAKAAKDTLNYRTQIMQSAQDASKAAITKRRNVERMKGSTSISAQKVDEALEDLQEAQEEEANLTRKVAAISAHLRTALRTHSRQVHDDAALVLLEHARSRILHERQALKELEALRPDVRNIGKGSAGRRQRGASVGSSAATVPSFAGPTAVRANQTPAIQAGTPSTVPTAQPGYMAQSAYLPSPSSGTAAQPYQQAPPANNAYRPQQPPQIPGGFQYPSNMAQSMYPGAAVGSMQGPVPPQQYASQAMAQSMYVQSLPPQSPYAPPPAPALSPQQLRQQAEAEAQARAIAQAQAAAARRRQENERAAARSLANMF